MKAILMISALFMPFGIIAPAQSQPPGFTFVTIPTTNNIQTALISTVPTATFIANNALATPFGIPEAPGKCGLLEPRHATTTMDFQEAGKA